MDDADDVEMGAREEVEESLREAILIAEMDRDTAL